MAKRQATAEVSSAVEFAPPLNWRGMLIHMTHYDPTWNKQKDTERRYHKPTARAVIKKLADCGYNLLLMRIDSERGEAYHPTQKPVALMQWVLGMMPEGVVLDPYMGSGSTLLAAKAMGRRAIGIEINESYRATAVRRLAQEVLQFGVAP